MNQIDRLSYLEIDSIDSFIGLFEKCAPCSMSVSTNIREMSIDGRNIVFKFVIEAKNE